MNWESFLLSPRLSLLSLYLSLVLRIILCLLTKPLWGSAGAEGAAAVIPCPCLMPGLFPSCREGTRLGEFLITPGLEGKLGAGQGLLHSIIKLLKSLSWAEFKSGRSLKGYFCVQNFKMNPTSCLSFVFEREKNKRSVWLWHKIKAATWCGTAFGEAGDKGWGAEKLSRR